MGLGGVERGGCCVLNICKLERSVSLKRMGSQE